jgi:hypothetical protein
MAERPTDEISPSIAGSSFSFPHSVTAATPHR